MGNRPNSSSPSSTSSGTSSGTPNTHAPLSTSKGQIHVKLISARSLNVSSIRARPYVVVQFEQNEFVSRDPTDETDKEVTGTATVLSRTSSSNALTTLNAIAGKSSTNTSPSSSLSSSSRVPSPINLPFQGLFGRMSDHNPVWKHKVSFDVTSEESLITFKRCRPSLPWNIPNKTHAGPRSHRRSMVHTTAVRNTIGEHKILQRASVLLVGPSPSPPWKMARFSALISGDSSDDEQTPYTPQDNRRPGSPTRSVDMDQHSSSSSSEEEEDSEEEEEEQESEDTSDMDEDDLAVAKPALKTRKHAPVEDSDGEIQYEHTRSRSGSSSSLEADSDDARRRGATVAAWAGRAGMDTHKMHVMQTSLFRSPEEEAALQAMNQPARPRYRLSPTKGYPYAHDIDHHVSRPSRKYARVDISSLADTGLALGRSFRVGWSSGGNLVHLSQLCGPSTQSQTSANSSVVTKTRVPFFSEPIENTSSRLSRLLQHHLSKTPIVKDEDGIPFADPSSDLCFSSFTPLYPKTDHSYEASLFRLGHALFDSMDLHLGQEVTVDVRNRISSIRRKAALSEWLAYAVTSSVDADLKKQSSSDPAALIFSLLSGYQIEKACDTALDCGSVKLATLISQASGDFEFREDLREQLQLWREQRIDVHVSVSIRKIYSILAGSVDVLEGSKASTLERCPDVDPLEGLDWKRTFGMYLWYVEPMDASISQVYDSYDRAARESPSRVAPSRPHYLEPAPSKKLAFHIPSPPPSDALFSLIRLYADPACSLSQVLSPLSFGPSPGDYSFPWHLYIILSRCMRIRDLSDRGESEHLEEEMDEDTSGRREGHSPSADLLASYYAQQLEQLGMLQEAIFVLLHIEGSAGREKAIRDVLHRSADKLDEWMCSGILGSLKIPLAWVNDVKALYSISQCKIFEAYELYMAAGLYQSAHDLAVVELAPEAVIRQDFELLTSLFERMAGQPVDGWHIKGKAYLDYAHAMTRLPELYASLSESGEDPDATEENELETTVRAIPKLMDILPDLLYLHKTDPRHKVALSEMMAGLTAVLDQVKPLALAQSQVRLTGMDEATMLRHIQTTALERFMRSIQAS